MKTPKNFMDYLKAHRDCTEETLEYANMLSCEDIDLATDAKTVRIRNMIRAVVLEIHRLRGFVRLVPLRDDVSHGYLEPEHETGRWIAMLLARRFPNTTIILGNHKRTWTARYAKNGMTYIDGGSIIDVLEASGKQTDNDATGEMEQLWATYYYSQYHPERRNIKLYRKNMPEKALKAAGRPIEQGGNREALAI
ncbi:MAG: DUF4130 domain-containing protein [Candidatus Altiarchaeota archaeon]|nr:DUF4130 domain-containing protein [Candidatus Altiarchaeota archaeon]